MSKVISATAMSHLGTNHQAGEGYPTSSPSLEHCALTDLALSVQAQRRLMERLKVHESVTLHVGLATGIAMAHGRVTQVSSCEGDVSIEVVTTVGGKTFYLDLPYEYHPDHPWYLIDLVPSRNRDLDFAQSFDSLPHIDPLRPDTWAACLLEPFKEQMLYEALDCFFATTISVGETIYCEKLTEPHLTARQRFKNHLQRTIHESVLELKRLVKTRQPAPPFLRHMLDEALVELLKVRLEESDNERVLSYLRQRLETRRGAERDLRLAYDEAVLAMRCALRAENSPKTHQHCRARHQPLQQGTKCQAACPRSRRPRRRGRKASHKHEDAGEDSLKEHDVEPAPRTATGRDPGCDSTAVLMVIPTGLPQMPRGHGDPSLLRLLVAAGGGDADPPDLAGKTPLMVAVLTWSRHAPTSTFSTLLEENANPYLSDVIGQHVFHIAAASVSQRAYLRQLARAGAPVP